MKQWEKRQWQEYFLFESSSITRFLFILLKSEKCSDLQELEWGRCMSEEKIIDGKRQILNLDLVITQHISYVRSLTITAMID